MKYAFFMCFAVIIVVTSTSCKTKAKTTIIEPTDKHENNNLMSITSPVIVYKTTRDFSDFVPVIMNSEKTVIISYPDRLDISETNKPTVLNNGYLLDNRGINENVAYLKLTYEAYQMLNENPTLVELINFIQEKYPLSEMYYCGNKSNYKDLITDLNNLISSGFPGCKKADVIPMSMEIKAE